ncbi:MAG: hypothetical protein ACREDR_37780, partial [Blastocatellia bacterium]
ALQRCDPDRTFLGGYLAAVVKGRGPRNRCHAARSAPGLARGCLKCVEILDYPDHGIEVNWKIEVKNFPKGNEFVKELNLG